MMTHEELRQQLPDYALNLLPPGQLNLVERHIAGCSSCRQAVGREREVGYLVQNTINGLTQLDSGRLRALMPDPPQKRRAPWNHHGWQRQFAPVMLILTLLFGALLTQRSGPSGGLPGFVTTAHAATATSTNTPTATAVQALTEKQAAQELVEMEPEINQDSKPMPSNVLQHPANTPEPLPTPLASVRQLLVQ